jgi:ribosomal protein L12E/L44/L45/RPP1/RPP2
MSITNIMIKELQDKIRNLEARVVVLENEKSIVVQPPSGGCDPEAIRKMRECGLAQKEKRQQEEKACEESAIGAIASLFNETCQPLSTPSWPKGYGDMK